MGSTDTPPEQLSERELFSEYVDVLDQDSPADGYGKAKLDERRARLLAEIGERLESLEAVKALLSDATAEHDRDRNTNDEQFDASTELTFDDG